MRSSSFASHQQRVAANFGADTLAHEIGLYHDHLEDGLGEVPGRVRAQVEILTRRSAEPYMDYIRRVRDSCDDDAIAVKCADLHDNLARCRGEHGGRVEPGRAKRYERALEILRG